MRHENVARGAAWSVAASLLAAACASGGPLDSGSFGFSTEMATTGDPDSVGTFSPDSSTGSDGPTSGEGTRGEDTIGATSMPPTGSEGSVGDGTAGPTCDGVTLEVDEDCDGADLGGEDCVSQGFAGGELACAVDCTFDTSGCTSAACGNGVIEGSEVCDGAALDGQTCASQGFDGGALGCAAGCGAYDTSGCSSTCVEQDLGNATGAAVAAGSTVGEDDTMAPDCVVGGADYVMSFTATVAGNYVFDTFGSGYDTALAVFADCGNGSQLACNDDAGAGLQSAVTVALAAGQTVNVVVDGYAGATGNWVLNIAPPLPPLPACAEQDLGSALGSPVATGTTVGQDEDLAQPCGANGAVDYVLRFVAPAAGNYVFDTFGSGYDTVLSLHDACGGAAVVCNDDTGGLQSQVSLAMAAGQQVLIAVSGYAGSTGNWVLNIVQM